MHRLQNKLKKDHHQQKLLAVTLIGIQIVTIHYYSELHTTPKSIHSLSQLNQYISNCNWFYICFFSHFIPGTYTMGICIEFQIHSHNFRWVKSISKWILCETSEATVHFTEKLKSNILIKFPQKSVEHLELN